jgi:CheY-like chemotaxis protein
MLMPGMNGMEVLQKLKSQEPTRDIPVVVLSASLADEKSALDAGATYFLKKPYDGRTLVATVESAMEHAPRPPLHSAG